LIRQKQIDTRTNSKSVGRGARPDLRALPSTRKFYPLRLKADIIIIEFNLELAIDAFVISCVFIRFNQGLYIINGNTA